MTEAWAAEWVVAASATSSTRFCAAGAGAACRMAIHAAGREAVSRAADPVAYAIHLEDMLPHFQDKLMERPGRPLLRTEEGASAVQEAIEALRARGPAQPLAWSRGLAGAASDHVADQGPIGGLEHYGTDGSDPARRAGVPPRR